MPSLEKVNCRSQFCVAVTGTNRSAFLSCVLKEMYVYCAVCCVVVIQFNCVISSSFTALWITTKHYGIMTQALCHTSECPKFASLVVMTNISCIVFHLIATCFFQVHLYLSFVTVRHSLLFIVCNLNFMHPVVLENKWRHINSHQKHNFVKIRVNQLHVSTVCGSSSGW